MKQLLKLAICLTLITAIGFSASAQNADKTTKNNRLKSWFKKTDKTPIILQKTERNSTKTTKIGKLNEGKMQTQKLESKTSTGKILRTSNSNGGKIIRNKTVLKQSSKTTRSETGMSKAKVLEKAGRKNQSLPSKSLPAKSSKTSGKTTSTKVVKAQKSYPTKVVKADRNYPTKVNTKSSSSKAGKTGCCSSSNKCEKAGKTKVLKNAKASGSSHK